MKFSEALEILSLFIKRIAKQYFLNNRLFANKNKAQLAFGRENDVVSRIPDTEASEKAVNLCIIIDQILTRTPNYTAGAVSFIKSTNHKHQNSWDHLRLTANHILVMKSKLSLETVVSNKSATRVFWKKNNCKIASRIRQKQICWPKFR